MQLKMIHLNKSQVLVGATTQNNTGSAMVSDEFSYDMQAIIM